MWFLIGFAAIVGVLICDYLRLGWFIIVVILGCGFVAVCSACVEFC